MTVSYKLVKDTAEIQANTLKAKAKADGEDVITPLIQQVATAVPTQVTTKDGVKVTHALVLLSQRASSRTRGIGEPASALP